MRMKEMNKIKKYFKQVKAYVEDGNNHGAILFDLMFITLVGVVIWITVS